MKFYIAYDVRYDGLSSIVAYHEDIEVVNDFIKESRNKNYELGRCRAKDIRRMPTMEDKYLVKFGDRYIQAEYYIGAEDLAQTEIADYKSCIEILQRVLEFKDLKSRKAVMKTVEELERLIEEERNDIDFECAKQIANNIKEMRYSMMKPDIDEYHLP